MMVGQVIGHSHLVGLDAKVHVPVGVAHLRRDLRRSDPHSRSGLWRIPLPAAKRDGPAVAHQEAIAGIDFVRGHQLKGRTVEEPRRRAVPPVRKIHEQRSVRLPLRDQQCYVASELDLPVLSLGQAQVGDPIIAGQGRIHRIVSDCIDPLVGPTTAEVLVCCVGLAAGDLKSRDTHGTYALPARIENSFQWNAPASSMRQAYASYGRCEPWGQPSFTPVTAALVTVSRKTTAATSTNGRPGRRGRSRSEARHGSTAEVIRKRPWIARQDVPPSRSGCSPDYHAGACFQSQGLTDVQSWSTAPPALGIASRRRASQYSCS